MNDQAFITAFENCALEPFHHRDHVRLAWIYLREHPFTEAFRRFVDGLKRFAASKGAAGLYHETITCAYLFLIRERIDRQPDASWESFVEANEDLFRWKPSILDDYYAPHTLASDRARRIFVLPDATIKLPTSDNSTKGSDPFVE